MVDEMLRQMNKKTRYKWTIYINIILFFIVALFLYLLVFDCIDVGKFQTGKYYLYIARDLAFLGVALALIFYQFFRNLFVIMRRSL